MDVIIEDLIKVDVELSDQKEVFDYLADRLVASGRSDDKDEVVEGFYERENEFSTAMEKLIAIPHTRKQSISQSSVSVLKLKNPVSWTDGEEIVLVFALMIPEENKNNAHLRILAQLAQLIMKDDFVNKINNSESSSEIYEELRLLNNIAEV